MNWPANDANLLAYARDFDHLPSVQKGCAHHIKINGQGRQELTKPATVASRGSAIGWTQTCEQG